MNDTPIESTAPSDPAQTSTGFHQVRNDARESALARYQTLVVGNRRFGALLLHELLITTLTYVPGLVGIVLRRAFYPFLFKRMARGVVIGTGVSLRQPGKMILHPGCMLDDLASLNARGDGDTRIELGRQVFIGRGSVLSVRNGQVELGDHANIGGACRIGCSGGTVRIGRHVLVGAFTYIGGGMHRHDRTDVPMALQGQAFKGGVTIEDDVWIGGGCQVLDGVTIGKGSIIGAGAIVTKDIPPYSIAFGNPALVRKKRQMTGAPENPQ
jgi:acetyltransferase-like isoleucine patch superfamily enzyme